MRPRLLDLFCGAGGSAMGYWRAGFDVVGIDIKFQPRYPFEFVQADALRPPFDLRDFDAIHASPPCQSYSIAMRHLAAPQPKLLEVVRERIQVRPFVIENVMGAPLINPIRLCGTSFNLPIQRHRFFESNSFLWSRDCLHDKLAMNPHNQSGRDRIYAEFGRQNPDPIWNAAMGVPWMNKHEGREAIPPAYTEFIGRQLIACL